MTTKILLVCGILASLFYIFLNVFVPMQWPEYDIPSQTVSELSAIGAPTRPLWVGLCIIYIVLFAAFGWGVLKSAGKNRHLRTLGGVILIYSLVNVYWPPMHLRGTEPTLTDTLHIVWAGMTLLLMLIMMGFGAAALNRPFRIFTGVCALMFLVFGFLTGLEGPNIALNLPTPTIGIWERINIGVFMIWVIALAWTLLKRQRIQNLIPVK